MQPHSDQHATARGSGGKISFIFPPGGFRFLSPCRKEQRDACEQFENVHYPCHTHFPMDNRAQTVYHRST